MEPESNRAVGGPLARIPALDGLRGLAILAVKVFHQTCLTSDFGLDREFLWLAQFLQIGVDLFFVLSGFLITGILLDAQGGPGYYRNFYARRLLRVVPLYYAILVVGLVVLPRVMHSRSAKWGPLGGIEPLWYWAFLSNWWIALRGYGPRNGLIDLSWTLSIEEQFYLVWPVVVRACSRRGLLVVCWGLIASALLGRLALVAGGAPPLWVHMMTPARWDALAVGALVALLARGPAGLAAMAGPAHRLAIGGGLILASLILAMRWSPAASPALAVAGGSVVAAAGAGLLVIAATSRPGHFAAWVFESRPLRTLGVYSFALYLFHNPIQALIRERFYGPEQFPRLGGSAIPGQLLFYVVATLPALACAWVSWHLFEGPILRLKRFFPSGHGTIGRPVAPPPNHRRAARDSGGVFPQ